MLLRPRERRESKVNFYSQLFPRLAMIFSVLKFLTNFLREDFAFYCVHQCFIYLENKLQRLRRLHDWLKLLYCTVVVVML